MYYGSDRPDHTNEKWQKLQSSVLIDPKKCGWSVQIDPSKII